VPRAPSSRGHRPQRSRAFYTPQQEAAALAAYLGGMPTDEITATHGLSTEAFYRALRRSGGMSRRKQQAKDYTNECIWCGDPFVAWRKSTGLYCSPECGYDARREQRRLSGDVPACKNCGFELPAGSRPWQMYCSPRCQAEAKRKTGEENARGLNRFLASGLALLPAAQALGVSFPTAQRLRRSFCPVCGTHLRKGYGSKNCDKCGWSNVK
jgi:predicted RNA-binding Zn-ribbon protein involved in translation (DUF1610 family)